jgi:hypothetical protein
MLREVNQANLGFKGPLLLTGFFVSVLKQHFFTPDGLFDDALKDILWRADNPENGTTDAKIYIDAKIIPNSLKSEFRPAILIERGEWSRTKLAHHDREGMSDVTYGDKIDRWKGTHSFVCIAKTYSQVEIIAHEVSTFFEIYGGLLADQICLDYIQVDSISAPSLLPENNESYLVTVTVSYQHHNRWSLNQLRPKIRHIRPVITVQDYDGRFEPKTTLTDLQYDG